MITLEAACDRLDDAVPLLTGDPFSGATSIVQESVEVEALEHLSDAELVRRAGRQVAIAICVVAKAMMLRVAVAVVKPVEVRILMRALAQSVQAATAALAKARE